MSSTPLISNPEKATSTFGAYVELSRIHKFAGTMVLFWPYAWTLTGLINKETLLSISYVELFVKGFIGASLLHSAGCVWNDVLDRELDRKVERTKHRPLADGRISVPGALAFLTVHLILLLGMVINARSTVWRFSLVAIFILPGIYPLMKRITHWPQAWLGLAMNVGAPMASLLIHGKFTASAIILFAAGWIWTMYYDTIYACQDKKDDVNAGIGSTALLFGGRVKLILSILGVGFFALLTLFGVVQGRKLAYFLISVVGGCGYLFGELYRVNLDDPKNCWAVFHRNAFHFGGLVWCGILIDVLGWMDIDY